MQNVRPRQETRPKHDAGQTGVWGKPHTDILIMMTLTIITARQTHTTKTTITTTDKHVQNCHTNTGRKPDKHLQKLSERHRKKTRQTGTKVVRQTQEEN